MIYHNSTLLPRVDSASVAREINNFASLIKDKIQKYNLVSYLLVEMFKELQYFVYS